MECFPSSHCLTEFDDPRKKVLRMEPASRTQSDADVQKSVLVCSSLLVGSMRLFTAHNALSVLACVVRKSSRATSKEPAAPKRQPPVQSGAVRA